MTTCKYYEHVKFLKLCCIFKKYKSISSNLNHLLMLSMCNIHRFSFVYSENAACGGEPSATWLQAGLCEDHEGRGRDLCETGQGV